MSVGEQDCFRTVISSITTAMYLGDHTRACVVGPTSGPLDETLLQVVDLQSNQTKTSTTITGGSSSAAELCGIMGLAKVLLAVAIDNKAGQSEGFLFEINETPDEISFSQIDQLYHDDKVNGSVSSIAYCTSLGLLAYCHESGVINIFDLRNLDRKPLQSITADAAGVNHARFDRMGRLVTAGNSGKQLKVWDLRSNIESCVVGRQDPAQGVGFTSLCPHPVNDFVFCGTSEGGLCAWDLRMETCLRQDRIHSEAVTSVVMHPASYGLSVISASSDGTVVNTDLEVKNTAHEQYPAGFPWAYESINIVTEPSCISSLDVHQESRSLLASTTIGGLYSQSSY